MACLSYFCVPYSWCVCAQSSDGLSSTMKETIAETLQQVDRNSDGCIDYSEFLSMFIQQEQDKSVFEATAGSQYGQCLSVCALLVVWFAPNLFVKGRLCRTWPCVSVLYFLLFGTLLVAVG